VGEQGKTGEIAGRQGAGVRVSEKKWIDGETRHANGGVLGLSVGKFILFVGIAGI
jgi:hypothetical protein